MSPEQAAGAPVDHRTDIYALGVILYEMASGPVPFDADNFMGILTQHMYKAPVPHPGARAGRRTCRRGSTRSSSSACRRSPRGATATMDELVGDLEKLEGGILPGAVHELMGRSSSFDATPGSTTGSMPHPAPASPAGARAAGRCSSSSGAWVRSWRSWSPSSWPAGPGARARTHDRRPRRPRRTLAPASPPGTAPATATATATSVAAAPTATASAAATVEVLLSVKPADATVTRDDQDLGSSPVALHLGTGESASLTVSRKGYKTKTVTVDGSEPKVTVTLEPSFTGGPAAAKPGGGIDDVGDPFANKH